MIIDARNRPPHPAFECLSDLPTTRRVNARYGFGTPRSFEHGSVDEWRDELRDCGVDIAVIMGRNTQACRIDNDVVRDLQDRGEGAVLGAAGIDVSGAVHDPLAELERCLAGGLYAVAIDPGTATRDANGTVGLDADDQRVVELCRACAEVDVPVFCLTGPYSGRDLSMLHPAALDRLLQRGGDVMLVASHGCWPYVREAIAAAYRHPNLYVCPDLYVAAPGGRDYLEAATGFLADQMLFGSAYPYAAPAVLLDHLDQLGFGREQMAGYLGGNAAHVLRRGLAHLGHRPPHDMPATSLDATAESERA